MEQYCETTKVCRRVPICVPICNDPCVPSTSAAPFTGPTPDPLPPVTDKK